MSTLLIILLIAIFLGVLPLWPYSSKWGYWPGSGAGLLFVVLLFLLATGRLPIH